MPQLFLTHCLVSGHVSRAAAVPSFPNTPHQHHYSSRLCTSRIAQQLPRKRTPARTGFPTTQRQPRVLRCIMGQGSSSVGKEDIGRQADQVVEALKDNGVKCVAFDMDQTLVARHSRGNLRRKNYDWFKGHVTEAFVELVPRLSSAGIKLAIATASDREEYRLKGTNSTTHMLGEDLVLPLLQDVVPDHAGEFFVVAYNPRARGAEGRMPENKGKLRHIRLTCEHYGIPEENVLLLDDENGNHSVHQRSNSKFYSVKVDGNKGIQLSTLLAQVGSLPPGGGIVSLPSFLDILLTFAP